ncbi:disks large-associated protein 5-like isoform X2 [Portunus trituberculatus]|nr:disks large-associated protein 5-like isoform X2 [Portunus trituberculatus]
MRGSSSNNKMSVEGFRDHMRRETNNLTNLCRHFKGVVKETQDIPEDVSGDIMVAVGQAELLMKERFTQFSHLIDDCELKRGEKEVTCQDLQGFWDIVYVQVEDVMNKFSQLKNLEKNGWVITKPSAPPLTKPPAVKKTENKKMGPPKPVKGNSDLRAMIQAARRKAKQEKENANGDVKESHFAVRMENKSPLKEVQEKQVENPFKTPIKPVKTKAALKHHTPGRDEVRVLASSLLREQLHMSPVVHKDYSPCMRVTRSMKAKASTKKLGF